MTQTKACRREEGLIRSDKKKRWCIWEVSFLGIHLEVKVGGDRCLGCHKSDQGRLPVRGSYQNSTWRRDGCVLFCSLWRACVLDFSLFPEDMKKAHKLESVFCPPLPNTQTPFRMLYDAMFWGKIQLLFIFWCPCHPAASRDPSRINSEFRYLFY